MRTDDELLAGDDIVVLGVDMKGGVCDGYEGCLSRGDDEKVEGDDEEVEWRSMTSDSFACTSSSASSAYIRPVRVGVGGWADGTS